MVRTAREPKKQRKLVLTKYTEQWSGRERERERTCKHRQVCGRVSQRQRASNKQQTLARNGAQMRWRAHVSTQQVPSLPSSYCLSARRLPALRPAPFLPALLNITPLHSGQPRDGWSDFWWRLPIWRRRCPSRRLMSPPPSSPVSILSADSILKGRGRRWASGYCRPLLRLPSRTCSSQSGRIAPLG